MKSKKYRLFRRIILFVALAIVISISVLPGGVWADEGTNAGEEAALDPLGQAPGWIYREVDNATGTAYWLFEDVWGGFWADAEKDPNPGDDLLCWAATASNMLEWTGWGFVGGMEFGNTDDFLQFFRDHVTDGGHLVDCGINWWFNGDLPDLWPSDPTTSEEDVDHTGFWSPTYDPANYVFASGNASEVMKNIRNELMAGKPVGLGIYPNTPPGGHGITCWGFNYDDAYSPDDIEYYLGVWVSDSDTDKHTFNPPNKLTYYAVSWNGTGIRWEMPHYGGGWHIAGVYSLAVFPGATRPEADGGGAYIGYEGTPVTVDASGSTDGGTLWYRWDFDNDAVWDTDWLTSTTANFTWDDDYDNNVYLEVFNERLRDMSITTATILNVAPTVTASGDTIDEGSLAHVSGSISDPGSLDSFTVIIDWGDGSTNTTNYASGTTWFSEYHQYLDDGLTSAPSDVYTVTVNITDDDGGVGTNTTTVIVNNVNPVVQEPYISSQPNEEFILPVIPGVEFAANFTDIGTLDTHTAIWDWGDGTTSNGSVIESGGSGNVTGSHNYTLPGDYTVTITVTDDDTGSHNNTMIVHVADVDEALEIFNQYIQDLDDSVFKSKAAQRKNAFSNVFSALQGKWLEQEYQGMIQDLRNSIRSKADGLLDGKSRDDWIVVLEAQEHICQKVDSITVYLEHLLGI